MVRGRLEISARKKWGLEVSRNWGPEVSRKKWGPEVSRNWGPEVSRKKWGPEVCRKRVQGAALYYSHESLDEFEIRSDPTAGFHGNR